VDDVGVRGSTISGTRKLSYVVRVQQPGRIELGELSLPFWDPERDSYRVARAQLGAIEVKPNPKAAKSALPPDADRLAGIVGVRKSLGAAAEPRRPWSDSAWYWLVLLLAPLGVVVAAGGARLTRHLCERAGPRVSRAESARPRARGQRAAPTTSRSPRPRGARPGRGNCRFHRLRARRVARRSRRARAKGVASELASELRALLDACERDSIHRARARTGRDADLGARGPQSSRSPRGNGRSVPPPASAPKHADLPSRAMLANSIERSWKGRRMRPLGVRSPRLAATASAAPDATPKRSRIGGHGARTGAWDEAIDQLELWPIAVSVILTRPDRAVAYVERARTPGARPGDLDARCARRNTPSSSDRRQRGRSCARTRRARSPKARVRARSRSRPDRRWRAPSWLLPERVWETAALVGSFALHGRLRAALLLEAPAPPPGSRHHASVGTLILRSPVAHAGRAKLPHILRSRRGGRTRRAPSTNAARQSAPPSLAAKPRSRRAPACTCVERRGLLAKVEWGHHARLGRRGSAQGQCHGAEQVSVSNRNFIRASPACRRSPTSKMIPSRPPRSRSRSCCRR
jgi:hypothetical protein